MKNAAIAALAIVGNYYLTTLAIWFGHWLSHAWAPLRITHVLGHHRLYPDARSQRTPRFLYSSGRHDSLIAQLPPHFLQMVLLGMVLPSWLFWTCLGELVALSAAFTWLHAQFHLQQPLLGRFAWFARAQCIHDAHHDEDVNFMVGDHFWDQVLGTYQPPLAEIRQ